MAQDTKPKRHLIGLCGRIGAGKSTLAKLLSDDFDVYVLAHPLKQIGKILGFEEHQLWGNQEQKLERNSFWGISGREFLQKLGTDIFRDLLPQKIPNMQIKHGIWIDLFVKAWNESTRNMIVEDVRFEDEVKVIQELGGTVIWIDRPNNPNKVGLSHASEMLTPEKIPNVFHIVNRDDLIDYTKEAARLYKHIGFSTQLNTIITCDNVCSTMAEQDTNLYKQVSWVTLLSSGLTHIKLEGNPPLPLLQQLQIDICEVDYGDCDNLQKIEHCQVNRIKVNWLDYDNYKFIQLLTRIVTKKITLILNMKPWLIGNAEYYNLYPTPSIIENYDGGDIYWDVLCDNEDSDNEYSDNEESDDQIDNCGSCECLASKDELEVMDKQNVREIRNENGQNVQQYLEFIFPYFNVKKDEYFNNLYYVDYD